MGQGPRRRCPPPATVRTPRSCPVSRFTAAYDPVGNRSSMTTYAGTTTSTYDAADRLTASSGPGATSYTYDANGNQLTAGSTSYTYDAADRMTSASVGSTTETYTWSGDGIRLSAATGPGAATTDFLVDRLNPLPELAVLRDGTGQVSADALFGLGRIGLLDPAGSLSLEHPDLLGSVTDRTSSSGASLAWAEYGPYGAVRTAGALAGIPADPFGFTGQYRDTTTGLLHLRARQYDRDTGRFLSTDPVAAAIGDPYVASYAYAANRPTTGVDPSGQCWGLVPAGAELGAQVGGGAGTVFEPGGGTLIGGGGGAVIGGAAGALTCGAIVVGTWILGSQAGKALQQPKLQPRPDPATTRAHLELLLMLQAWQQHGAGGPGNDFCQRHRSLCRVIAGIPAASIIAGAFAGFRSLEDEFMNRLARGEEPQRSPTQK
jgi:RHS repeat-associated protein